MFATDRCHVIEDPWRDRAVPIRFHDEEAAVADIVERAAARPLGGILVVGDRPAVIGARVAQALGLPGHPPEAAACATHKQRARERLQSAGLAVPWFRSAALDAEPRDLARSIQYPAVIKPLALSGSRGVMRADDPDAFVGAFDRLRTLLQSPDVRAERNDAHDSVLIEGFIPGREYALEGLLDHGRLHVLALFDKPDALDGPFFEETIYVTPSIAAPREQAAMTEAVGRAAEALGLVHGPVHAECRVSTPSPGQTDVFVLEVAPRPIGGLCARALRFERRRGLAPGGGRETAPICSLEELLLRHALGESPAGYIREQRASGVMMIPIPRGGIFRWADGLEEAREVAGIDDIRITAKADQRLIPLPEGASYLGFIFARGDSPDDVTRALRGAHGRLRFTIDPHIPVVGYNPSHG